MVVAVRAENCYTLFPLFLRSAIFNLQILLREYGFGFGSSFILSLIFWIRTKGVQIG